MGTRPNAGYAIGWNGADVDVGEIFAFGIRMPGKVTHARAVNMGEAVCASRVTAVANAVVTAATP